MRPPRRRIVVIAAVAAVVVAAEVVVEVRTLAPLPQPSTRLDAPATLAAAPGSPPPVALPPTGSIALLSDTGDTLASANADVSRPIGSVAKTMTALMVLGAHPLQAASTGPSLTITSQDVTLYEQAVAAGGSAVPVRAGERLSERDLLLALLLPSANNIADTLARWVDGSVGAFVAHANREAAALGMHQTHFDDASGVSAQTVSSADDLVVLARAALAQAAFAELVRTQSATLSDGTVVHSLDIALGANPDWLGIKTGWTAAAGGCLLFAARHAYAAQAAAVTVYGAVLGQPPDATVDPDHPELGRAFAVAQDSVHAAVRSYAAVDLSALTPAVQGRLEEPWGAGTSLRARPSGGVIVVRRGEVLRLRTSMKQPTPSTPAGAQVGAIDGALRGKNVVTWPIVTDDALEPPGFWWRLTR
ncbi:MAG: D-alanyl-D-alanine carboxypeptidase family protein [Candidatus Dormibacteria bacterium]